MVEWNLFLVDFIGRACGYDFPQISYICACLDQFYYSINTWRILNIWLSIAQFSHNLSPLGSKQWCFTVILLSIDVEKSDGNLNFFFCPQTLWYIQCNLYISSVTWYIHLYIYTCIKCIYTSVYINVLTWYTYTAIWVPRSVI